MPQIVWTSDNRGNATYYNRRWFEYTGMAEGEVDDNCVVARDAPGRPAGGDDAPRADARRRHGLRGRVPIPRCRRDLSLAPRARGADPRRDRRDRLLDRHRDGHRRPQAHRRRRSGSCSTPAPSSRCRSTGARGCRQIAKLAVPRSRRLVRGPLREADGTISTLSVEHADPAKLVFAQELQERYPPDPANERGAAAVIRYRRGTARRGDPR